MPRVAIIVLDSFGVGELPDADRFDDVGCNTLGHILENVEELHIPHMRDLGLYNIEGLGLSGIKEPAGCFGKCAEKVMAKDSTNGHFEMMGLISEEPMKVFGEHFPDRIIKELERRIGVKTIGNYPASGTEIIQVLGDEHVATGYPIVYLSADSLMQIAMHEEIIPLERQYEICQIARDLMTGDDTVDRIICRPFIGGNGHYTRTENRRDYSIDPPGETLLDRLKAEGRDVLSVGKIDEMFNKRGITESDHTKNNHDGIEAIIRFLKNRDFNGLLFANLVDFDMLYGHRRNIQGYADALEYFDSKMPEIMSCLKEDDILMITADHGCDPAFKGTDHTREYVPILVYGQKLRKGVDLSVRESFADIAATTAEALNVSWSVGKSFLKEIKE